MQTKDITTESHRTFEDIKHVDDNGDEFWLARELAPILEYATWDKFFNVIKRAMESAKNSGQPPDDHFSHMGKMVIRRLS